MSTFTDIFGAELVGKNGNVSTVEALNGKYVGIYFSAHWCPPCRGFTPEFAKWYNNFRNKRPDFEVVFVSSDKNQHGFDEYYGEMPWLALPYQQRAMKESLSKQFKVNGIPYLVILDPNGNVVTNDGRAGVMSDPQGAEFPWPPKPLRELFGETVTGKNGPVPLNSVFEQNDLVGVFVGAQWAPTSAAFLPTLKSHYQALKAADKKFEVIFISADKTQAMFDDHYGGMPWLSIPFSDKPRIQKLFKALNIEGVPTLALLDKNCKIVSLEGAQLMDEQGESADFISSFPSSWVQPVCELVPARASALNDNPCVIAFLDGTTDGEFQHIKSVLDDVAVSVTEKERSNDVERVVRFFYSRNPSGQKATLTSMVKKTVAVTTTPAIVLVDIPEGQCKYNFSGDVKSLSTEGLMSFVENFRGGSLQGTPLSE